MREFTKLFGNVYIALTEDDIHNEIFTENIPIVMLNNKRYMQFICYINKVCNPTLDINTAEKVNNIIVCRLSDNYCSSANALLNAIGLGTYEVYSENGWTYIKFTIKLSDDEQLNKQED